MTNLIFKNFKWLLVPLVLLTLSIGNVWGAVGDALKTYDTNSSTFSTGYGRKSGDNFIWWGQKNYYGANNATNHGNNKPTANDLPVVKAQKSDATTSTTGYYYLYTSEAVSNVGAVQITFSAKSGSSTVNAYIVSSSTAASSGSATWTKLTLLASSPKAQGANVASNNTYTFTIPKETSAKYYGIVFVTSSYWRATGMQMKLLEGCTAPTAVAKGTVTSSSFGLTITDAANAGTYEVYFSESSTAPDATTSSGYQTVTTKTPTITSGVAANKTYYVWVRSVKTVSSVTYKSAWVALTGSTLTTPSACTELGTINGSVSLSQLASPDPTKLKATWTMNASTGISSYNLEVYNSSDVLVKTVNGYTSGSEITGLTPCTTYYVKLYTVSSGGDYCAGGLISTSSTCTTNGYTITYTKTNVSKSSGTEVTNQCSADEVDVYYAADDGYNLPATITVTNAGEEDEDWSWDSGTGELIILDLTAITGNVTVTITGVSAGCSGQYCIDSYDTGGNGMSCFTGASTSRTISNYVIPSSYLDDRNTDFWVGYGGSWVSGKSANWHFRWIPLKDRPGGCSMTLGVAAQAIGTLTINSGTAGSDNNYELTFDPNGYGFVYGSGVSWSNKAFVQQADPTVWRTTTFALTSAEIGKNYYVGLAKSGGGYVKTLDYDYNDADEHIWGPSYESTISGMGVASGKSAGTVTFRGSGLSTPSDDGMRGFYEIWSNNCNRNFYCHFVPVHRIIYDANWPAGASGVEPSDTYSSDVPVIESSNITVPAAPSAPTVGYHFVEWNTASNGSGTGYDPGDTYNIAVGTSADVTLYAIWEKDEYTITKTLTNVSCTPTIPSTYTYTGSAAGLSYTFTANSGYALPSSVTVSGTTYTWNQGTGVLSLTGTITGNVSITVVGVAADTYIDLMHDNSTQVFTSSYTVPTFTTDATGSTCEGTHKYFAGFSNSVNSTTIVKEAGATGQTVSGATYYAVWGDGVPTTTYSRLESVASIDGSAQYVLGIDGTGFHYSGTSSWGLTALPASQTPYYYTLSIVDASSGTFTASTTISSTTYYLTVPTSNTFTMSESSTTLYLGQGSNKYSDTYGICNSDTKDRHIRRNGDSGLRSYASTTGSQAYFYKVVASGDIDYKTKCCADAAVVTLSPSSQTVYKDIDGNAAATIGFSQTGGGAGTWGTPTVTPSGPTVTKDGSNINFSHTATGTFTVGIGYTETCEKTGSATVTVAEQGIISASGTTTFSPSCGANSASSDITVNSRYLAGSTITASIATSTGSGNFTISTDNSTFNTSNKSISGGTSAKVTSHIYVRYEPTVDETGSIAGRLTLTQGGTTTYVDLTGTVTCGCNIRFTSAANLVQITAANGIWVQANTELALSGSYLKSNADGANVSIRAYTNNAHFQIKTSGTNGEGTAKTSSASALSLATNEGSNTAGGWTGNIGIVYKPAAHNTTETATLTVEVYRYGGSTVYSTATYTLYGRSLPENFVIAVTDGSGHWFAVPADMIAPWGGSCTGLGTYTPYPITVDNNSVPTTATSAPSRAIYTAAARTGTVNTNPQTMSYKSVPLAGSGNYYLYGSSGSATTIQNASNASSEQQKWFLDVVNWANKEYNMHLHTDLNTRVLAYTTAGGANNVGEYAANVATTKKSIYILPVSATCTYYAAPAVTCYAVDATNYTVRFDCDRTSDYEISTNSGSTWSDLSVTEAEVCTEVPKKLQAVLPWATYRGLTIQIRAKSAGGCQAIGSFTVPNPNVAVNAGTWMTMSGIAGYAFNNTANSVTISGLASCGNQNVSVSCSNNDISASVNQSTGAVTISMTAGAATAGVHSGTLTFTLAGGTTRTQTIQITLTALAVQTFTANGDYFSSNILCDNTGDISSSSVYPFALTYQCFNSDGTAADLGDFNDTDTKVTDLTTGADLTGSVTREFNSAGTHIRYALNVQYSQFVPGHKYRITWINTGQVMCNSSGVPYQDCYYDFIFSKDCTKPTALEACPINKTSFTANWTGSCAAANSTVTVYTKGTSTLASDDFADTYTGTSSTTFNLKQNGKYCSNQANNALSRSTTYGFSMNYCIYSPILGTWKNDLTTTDELTITVEASNKTSGSQTLTIYVIASANVAASNSPTAKTVTINGSSASSISTSSIASNGTGSVTFTIKGLETTDRLFFKQSGASSSFYLSALTIRSVTKTTVATATPTCSAGHVEITGLTANTQYYYTVTNNGNTSNEMDVKTRAGNPIINFRDNEENVITHVDLATAVGIPTSQTVEVYATRATICDLEDMITSLSGSGAGMFTVTADFSTWTFYPQIGTYYGDITITYQPMTAGDHTATYSITDNATTSNLTLNGTATGGQIEIIQWDTHGISVESYVIASGTPHVDSYTGVLQANGTYQIYDGDEVWDLSTQANSEITVEWGATSESFRVPIMIRSDKSSSALTTVTGESDIVVGPDRTFTIDNALVCHGIELYPTSKVVFSSGSLTAKYIRLYNNGDTWANFPSFDASGASAINVDNVYVDFRIDESRYHYVTLPFGVMTGDVTYAAPTANGPNPPALRNGTNNTAFYVRQYDGRAREMNDKATETTYNVNMPHIGTAGGNYAMTAGRGYMIAIGDQATATGHAKRTLRFPLAMTSSNWTAEKASSKVVGGAWVADGSDNGSARATNKGWNLVGNPFMRELAVTSTSGGISTGKLNDTGENPKWEITDESVRYITIYNAASDAFTYQSLASSFTLKPMAAFYLQMNSAKYINFQAAMTGQAAAMPALMRNEEPEEEVSVVLSLSNDVQADKAGVVLHSKYDAAYNETDDADYPKLMSGTQVALWSIASDEPLASNGLPKTATENIPLGIQAPKDGHYIFALDIDESNMKWLKHVWLTDIEMSAVSDLMLESYEFEETQAEKREDRFLLGIELYSKEELMEGTENIESDYERPQKFIWHDNMYILRGGVIYDATGKRVGGIIVPQGKEINK